MELVKGFAETPSHGNLLWQGMHQVDDPELKSGLLSVPDLVKDDCGEGHEGGPHLRNTAIEVQEAVVGDGDSVGIVAEVVEDMFANRKGTDLFSLVRKW